YIADLACDNCPTEFNPDQTNIDCDIAGDLCDLCPTMYDEQYDFDKPWDSPENLAVAQLDVPAYRCPSDPNQAPSANQPMQTSYMVVSGQGAMFDGPQAHSLSQIKDGLSNTLAVVEATGQNVGWTQPRDITPQELKDLVAGKGEPQARSSYHPGGFNAALGDGSIRFISNSVATSVLDALLTIAGND
ncbi:MAG: DUF1559 domain-containing protein, partial [Pirellulaceae bacterium]|nr:DUF1559 domain-containing protein [Pirellulaceae bacterium]